jgi:catechol-2,3-dioxygenase
MTASIRRLNHAVLYVRDARKAAKFYEEAFGFVVAAEMGDGAAVFMHAADTENDHDLGLFSLGPQAPPPQAGRVGLYHLAWEVDTIHDLAAMRERLVRMDALVGESDHGVSKSLYAKDVDGNEFEVMWALPVEQRAKLDGGAVTRRLDLAAELAEHG